MTRSLSRFVRPGRPLTGRERRFIAGGGAVALLILLVVKLAVPMAGHWKSREDAIAAKAMELGKLQALMADSAALGRRASVLRIARARRQATLLDGGTPALAGSVLQSLIRDYGERSRVLIQRMDPVPLSSTGALPAGPEAGREAAPDAAPDAAGAAGLAPVGLSLSGRGDIYGLVDFLDLLENGVTLLVVDEMRVSTSAGRTPDDLLTWTIRVTGFFARGEGAA